MTQLTSVNFLAHWRFPASCCFIIFQLWNFKRCFPSLWGWSALGPWCLGGRTPQLAAEDQVHQKAACTVGLGNFTILSNLLSGSTFTHFLMADPCSHSLTSICRWEEHLREKKYLNLFFMLP
jgi:hypothetical protein